MQDSFLVHEDDYENWRDSGYPDVKSETRDFIDNVLKPDKKVVESSIRRTAKNNLCL